MKQKIDIKIVDGDDWSGLYINGELKDEGHSLRVSEVLEILGFKVETFEADYDWLEEMGSLPKKFSQVKIS